jgi:hypothetical protein
MRAVSYAEREPERFRRGQSWKINLFGKNSDVPSSELQAFRLDLNAHQTLDSHFHIVDQFQVFIAGCVSIGRDTVHVVTAHYADHHTGYGPLVAGAQGLSYLTLRSKTDAGLVYLKRPDVREQLQPSKKRHRVSSPVILSIDPVLQNRDAVTVESVMPEEPGDDGMGVKVIRLGSGMSTVAPDPGEGGGQYLIVLNGSLHFEGRVYRPFSLVWVAATEAAPVLQAGEEGLELMVTRYAREDEWMQSIQA